MLILDMKGLNKPVQEKKNCKLHSTKCTKHMKSLSHSTTCNCMYSDIHIIGFNSYVPGQDTIVVVTKWVLLQLEYLALLLDILPLDCRD